MSEFDFDKFLESPCDFIQERIQARTDLPDFGISEDLGNVISNNQGIIKKIPLVTNLSEVHMCPPEKLVRIRAVMRSYNDRIVVPGLIETANGNYSYLARSKIPEDMVVEDMLVNETPDMKFHVADASQILVELINIENEWVKEYLKDQKPSAPTKPTKCKECHDHSDEPVLVLVRDLNQNEKLFKLSNMVDIIGYFEEPVLDESVSPFSAISSYVPSFCALHTVPVSYIYDNKVLENDQLQKGRQLTLDALKTVFDPKAAELVLLWLVSRVRSRVGAQLVGSFSLNLFGIDPEKIPEIIQFLQQICTSVVYYTCSIDNLNQKQLKPVIDDETYKSSPIWSFDNNRYVFDETQLTEGNLNEVGAENLRLINELVNFQSMKIQHYYDIKVDVSYPSLVLSTTRSLIDCDVHAPCELSTGKSINFSDEDIALIRTYVDQARFSQVHLDQIPKESYDSAVSRMVQIFHSNQKMSQTDLNIFIEIASLIMISKGLSDLSKDVLDEAVSILEFVIPHRK
ncbi:hypothetical protein TVAG_357790 [Trichomonas vaginalis G3]|uniref:Mini-chromosome maintenance complex-binding protein n=1 Tax=Trichomonas vaginalis (strain ATCC PRA-98 / G3) TaxID=412133 RepID=A2F3C6_TRIV3|nr:sister chromatid cohesion [Trichomonas vaginalis G3]EAY00573.1 hypothetical protein TVAG_357790 [Trichomonas vaginalis G3]KAI5547892.1 sister chromatid cohesion [Trichomonas vaginalis G3]|eukprot:XP_001313502.1 hypothetical protein [Trichomonas vaginalis G3]